MVDPKLRLVQYSSKNVDFKAPGFLPGLHLPDLGLLLGLGGGHDAGRLPADLFLQPRPAVPLVLPLPPGLVLRRRAREALGTHDSRDVLLAALPGLGDGLGYYPVSLFLLVLHLMVRSPLRLLL